jgi:hypothetical protein
MSANLLARVGISGTKSEKQSDYTGDWTHPAWLVAEEKARAETAFAPTDRREALKKRKCDENSRRTSLSFARPELVTEDLKDDVVNSATKMDHLRNLDFMDRIPDRHWKTDEIHMASGPCMCTDIILTGQYCLAAGHLESEETAKDHIAIIMRPWTFYENNDDPNQPVREPRVCPEAWAARRPTMGDLVVCGTPGRRHLAPVKLENILKDTKERAGGGFTAHVWPGPCLKCVHKEREKYLQETGKTKGVRIDWAESRKEKKGEFGFTSYGSILLGSDRSTDELANVSVVDNKYYRKPGWHPEERKWFHADDPAIQAGQILLNELWLDNEGDEAGMPYIPIPNPEDTESEFSEENQQQQGPTQTFGEPNTDLQAWEQSLMDLNLWQPGQTISATVLAAYPPPPAVELGY